jgi:hypothetical protein
MMNEPVTTSPSSNSRRRDIRVNPNGSINTTTHPANGSTSRSRSAQKGNARSRPAIASHARVPTATAYTARAPASASHAARACPRARKPVRAVSTDASTAASIRTVLKAAIVDWLGESLSATTAITSNPTAAATPPRTELDATQRCCIRPPPPHRKSGQPNKSI